MNKELTPLEALENLKNLSQDVQYASKIPSIDNELEVIETALKRLKNYEQNEDFNKDVLNYAFLNEQDKIKKLKALEIIKKKVIPYSVWNRSMIERAFDEGWITQEEYDLLKEVLK